MLALFFIVLVDDNSDELFRNITVNDSFSTIKYTFEKST